MRVQRGMKVQQRTYDRIVENINAVGEMFQKDKSVYTRQDFKTVSEEMGISIARIKRAYENISEFGVAHLGLGHISNAVIVPNKPVVQRSNEPRRVNTNTYIKRKDPDYVEKAKRIIHDRIFTNLTVKEIAERWGCSNGRVGSLINEVSRYGSIKLPKYQEYSLINLKTHKDVNVKDMISVIKNETDLSETVEKKLRYKLLTRVLKDALQPEEVNA